MYYVILSDYYDETIEAVTSNRDEAELLCKVNPDWYIREFEEPDVSVYSNYKMYYDVMFGADGRVGCISDKLCDPDSSETIESVVRVNMCRSRVFEDYKDQYRKYVSCVETIPAADPEEARRIAERCRVEYMEARPNEAWINPSWV